MSANIGFLKFIFQLGLTLIQNDRIRCAFTGIISRASIGIITR